MLQSLLRVDRGEFECRASREQVFAAFDHGAPGGVRQRVGDDLLISRKPTSLAWRFPVSPGPWLRVHVDQRPDGTSTVTATIGPATPSWAVVLAPFGGGLLILAVLLRFSLVAFGPVPSMGLFLVYVVGLAFMARSWDDGPQGQQATATRRWLEHARHDAALHLRNDAATSIAGPSGVQPAPVAPTPGPGVWKTAPEPAAIDWTAPPATTPAASTGWDRAPAWDVATPPVAAVTPAWRGPSPPSVVAAVPHAPLTVPVDQRSIPDLAARTWWTPMDVAATAAWLEAAAPGRLRWTGTGYRIVFARGLGLERRRPRWSAQMVTIAVAPAVSGGTCLHLEFSSRSAREGRNPQWPLIVSAVWILGVVAVFRPFIFVAPFWLAGLLLNAAINRLPALSYAGQAQGVFVRLMVRMNALVRIPPEETPPAPAPPTPPGVTGTRGPGA